MKFISLLCFAFLISCASSRFMAFNKQEQPQPEPKPTPKPYNHDLYHFQVDEVDEYKLLTFYKLIGGNQEEDYDIPKYVGIQLDFVDVHGWTHTNSFEVSTKRVDTREESDKRQVLFYGGPFDVSYALRNAKEVHATAYTFSSLFGKRNVLHEETFTVKPKEAKN